MNKQSVVVLRDWNGMALIDVMATAFSISKKKAKLLLDRKAVILNGRRTWIAKHVVNTGDVLEAVLPNEEVHGRRETKPIIVHFEDEYMMIVEKPAGMLTNGRHSFEEQVNGVFKNKSLRAVHRLDRDTSGLLIVSKTKEVFDQFVALFKSTGIKKTYHAIVLGGDLNKSKTLIIDSPLEGKSGYTEIAFLRVKGAVALCAVEIKTGRTHQIRKHLFSKGMQILGDREYEIKRAATENYRAVGRQMLHASHLSFVHPVTEEKVSIDSLYPEDFKDILKKFQLS